MKRIAQVIAPLSLFTVGFAAALALNGPAAAARAQGGYDAILNRLDARLFGFTVPALVAWASLRLPVAAFTAAELIYLALMPAIGVMLILISVRRGEGEGLRFAATLLAAYGISLAVFHFVPAVGPSLLAPDLIPPSLGVAAYQRLVAAQFTALAAGRNVAGAGYLVACPSMHIAQAVVLAWGARPWPWLRRALTGYVIVLIPAILLLEQHYVVDLLAGAAVAAVAIALVENLSEGIAAKICQVKKNCWNS